MFGPRGQPNGQRKITASKTRNLFRHRVVYEPDIYNRDALYTERMVRENRKKVAFKAKMLHSAKQIKNETKQNKTSKIQSRNVSVKRYRCLHCGD